MRVRRRLPRWGNIHRWNCRAADMPPQTGCSKLRIQINYKIILTSHRCSNPLYLRTLRGETMKYPTLIRMAAFAMALAAAGGVSVRASVITLDLSATTRPDSPNAACSPTCTLGGDIVINNSTGAIVSADVTATGFSPTVGPFTINPVIFVAGFVANLTINDAAGDSLAITFPAATSGSL